ncbi:hypothetical protein [Chitinophaga niabensis]|uniref:Uncharacterized protein n=1 Tax=Chitinophaga niabensis TaxID=536979 RepID=A0A1N6KAI3_9BACT|nr:hypothetical protein [Chitinophaga niabensis]SIO53558.1 hypothetical protein SAMN04488055_5437 [Chitinophaga niabensis]
MAKVPSPKLSYLGFLYYQFLDLSLSFRERVCTECGWSEATFYRKAKSKKGLSKADKERIMNIFQLLLDKVISNIKDYSGNDL